MEIKWLIEVLPAFDVLSRLIANAGALGQGEYNIETLNGLLEVDDIACVW